MVTQNIWVQNMVRSPPSYEHDTPQAKGAENTYTEIKMG